MSDQEVGPLRRGWRGFWRFIRALRIGIANVLFLLVLVFALFLLFGGESETVKNKSMLLLAPTGTVVDQRSFVDPLARMINPEVALSETPLHDLIEVVQQAAKDPRMIGIALDLDELLAIDISSARELGAALQAFRSEGKKVVAMADNYDQNRYLLATYADEINLHPMGEVSIKGFGVYPNYFKDLLDRLNVDVHVFRVGTFKSAVEPFMRNDMSPAAKQNNARWLSSVWANYTSSVALNRDLDADSIDAYANNYDEVLEAAQGDAARAALDRGLVDNIMGREAMLGRVAELTGRAEPEDSLVHFYEYLEPSAESLALAAATGTDVVGIVAAEGMIVDGRQPPGTAAGDSIAALLRKAREDDAVKAVVLRINSPGGSAFASEVIREQVMLTQQAGKPVVASMGSTAASGGFWIATGAAEIWAQPTTITGSIGIFGVFPTINRTLEEWGIHSDGVGTTRMTDAFRVDRPLSEIGNNALQSTIEHGYRQFIELVSEARGMTPEAVDAVAQGQVWSGENALAIGLVDELGGLQDAVAAAAKLAELTDYESVWVSADDWLDAGVWRRFIDASASAFAEAVLGRLLGDFAGVTGLQKPFSGPLRNDSRGVYLHCMECVAR